VAAWQRGGQFPSLRCAWRKISRRHRDGISLLACQRRTCKTARARCTCFNAWRGGNGTGVKTEACSGGARIDGLDERECWWKRRVCATCLSLLLALACCLPAPPDRATLLSHYLALPYASPLRTVKRGRRERRTDRVGYSYHYLSVGQQRTACLASRSARYLRACHALACHLRCLRHAWRGKNDCWRRNARHRESRIGVQPSAFAYGAALWKNGETPASLPVGGRRARR
jgi:hypothetical protein